MKKLTVVLLLLLTCAIQKKPTPYDFICFLPDGEGGETNTMSGRISDLKTQDGLLMFRGPDGKKVVFSNIKCVFKEVEASKN